MAPQPAPDARVCASLAITCDYADGRAIAMRRSVRARRKNVQVGQLVNPGQTPTTVGPLRPGMSAEVSIRRLP